MAVTKLDVGIETAEGKPVEIAWNRPNYVAGSRASVHTKLLDELEEKTRAGVKADLDRVFKDAVTHGTHPYETAANMRKVFEEHIEVAQYRLTRIARTEQLDAYRAGGRAAELANADVLEGWIWAASLSATSCPSCIALNGTKHPLDESGPDDHPNGRCYRVPVTKSWKDLGFNIADRPVEIDDSAAFFASLTESQQKDILTQRGYRAWRAGGYRMEDWARVVPASSQWRRHFTPARAPWGPWDMPPPSLSGNAALDAAVKAALDSAPIVSRVAPQTLEAAAGRGHLAPGDGARRGGATSSTFGTPPGEDPPIYATLGEAEGATSRLVEVRYKDSVRGRGVVSGGGKAQPLTEANAFTLGGEDVPARFDIGLFGKVRLDDVAEVVLPHKLPSLEKKLREVDVSYRVR